MNNIVVLISGGGSNMRALVQASTRENWAQRHRARISLVLSNRADAPGLTWAQQQGLDTAVVDHRSFAQHANPREAFEAEMRQHIDRHAPVLVLLASVGGVCVALAWRGMGRLQPGQPMPFGPYLAAAGALLAVIPASRWYEWTLFI